MASFKAKLAVIICFLIVGIILTVFGIVEYIRGTSPDSWIYGMGALNIVIYGLVALAVGIVITVLAIIGVVVVFRRKK